MTNPTVILSQRFSTDSQTIWSTAIRRGWDVHRAIRFQAPDPLPERRFCYGEISFCDIMADRAKLGLLDPPDDWLARLPRELLQREVLFIYAKDIPIYLRGRAFVKPANDKVFEKGVYESGRDVPLKYVDPMCPCYVSDVVAFEVEYRFWFLDGVQRGGDYYRMIGDRNEAEMMEQASEFAATVMLAHGHELPSAIVLDVGLIEGHGWAVVEVNQCHASGIYGDTSVDGVLACCERSAGPVEAVSDRDRPFLRKL